MSYPYKYTLKVKKTGEVLHFITSTERLAYILSNNIHTEDVELYVTYSRDNVETC